jgi:hypothetical protein
MIQQVPNHNPFMVDEELLKLQMPDHRGSVVTSTENKRPESKKGFDINALDHVETSNSGIRQNPTRTAYDSDKDQIDEMTGEIDEPEAFENEPYFGQPPEMEQHRYEENKANNNINLEDAIEIEKQITKISESLRSEIDPTMD